MIANAQGTGSGADSGDARGAEGEQSFSPITDAEWLTGKNASI
jgi:hypothetical protein